VSDDNSALPTYERIDGALPARVDLVVIGAGVAGAATAYFAARAGLRVLVVERRSSIASLTTAAATGAFRLQHDNVDELALVQEGLPLYLNFAEESGLTGWNLDIRQQGYLFCSRTEASAAKGRELVALQRTFGLTDVELLSGDEARARWPYLAPEIRQVRFRAGDGFIDQVALANGYAAASSHAAQINGATGSGHATYALETIVTGFVRDASGAFTGVRTNRGDVHAPQTVIAAGPWSGVVAKLAALDLPIAPTIRQKLVIPNLPAIDQTAPMTIDDETGSHWRPALAGAYALRTDPTTPVGEPLLEVPTDEAMAHALLDPASPTSLALLAPFWRDVWRGGPPAWHLMAGQYEYTPDHRPFIGPTDQPGLFVNTGYSGHGVMCSAGGARRTVDLLLGRAAAAEEPFRVGRPMTSRARDVL
jgi:sarcosine oxidase subunit beta